MKGKDDEDTKSGLEERQAEADAGKFGDNQGDGAFVQILFPIRYALSCYPLARDPRCLYRLRPLSVLQVP